MYVSAQRVLNLCGQIARRRERELPDSFLTADIGIVAGDWKVGRWNLPTYLTI